MAEHLQRFDPVVIAEMRGVIDDRGGSPFWDAIGKHFFEIDFPKADYLSMVNKKFIADLMPTHPIYVPLLPPEAQAVIGQVHDQTRPAWKMLSDEGFAFTGMIDIFEGGPVVSCRRDTIRTVRQSHRSTIVEVADHLAGSELEEQIIANTRRDFRVCKGQVEVNGDQGVRITNQTALSLQAKVGDVVRHVSLRAPALVAQGSAADEAEEQLSEAVPGF